MDSSRAVDLLVLAGLDAGAVVLARAAVAAGLPVVVVEEDAHDAERVQATLGKAGVVVPVRTVADPAGQAEVVVAGPSFDAASLKRLVAGCGARAVGLTGPHTEARASGPLSVGLSLHHVPGGRLLLEVVAVDGTAERAAERLMALARRLRLDAIRTRGAGAMLWAAWMDAADGLILEGAAPWEVDEALTEAGFSIGPFELEDLAGLDLRHASRLARGGAFRGLAEHAAAEGRLGKKSGVGWYRYPGGGGAVIDPLVEDLVRHEAHFGGIEARSHSAQELRDRMIAALREAARAVRDRGLVEDPCDTDRLAVAALGYPLARLGPVIQLPADARERG